MELLTKQYLIAIVAERFKAQYSKSSFHWYEHTTFKPQYTYEQIYNRLLEAKTEKDVFEAIGSKTWTENKCHECGLDCDTVIILGERPDYESNTAQICIDCLKKAMSLFDALG